MIDKSRREDGTFSRADFVFDKERNVYFCPATKCCPQLVIPAPTTRFATGRHGLTVVPACSNQNAVQRCPRAGSYAM